MKPEGPDLHRGATALGVVALVSYFLDYGFNLCLTRFLSPHDYGDFKVAWAFAIFCGPAVLLGGDRAASMFLAPSLERGEARRVWEYLRFYIRVALSLGFALITITWTLGALKLGTLNPLNHHPLTLAAMVVPINAIGTMISRAVQASRRPVRAAVPWRIGLRVIKLSLFGAMVAWQGQLSINEAIAIAIAGVTLVTAWQWLDGHRLGIVEFERDAGLRESGQWLKASLPMMGSFLAALALSQSDLYFLELLGDEAEVGHYAATSTVAHFVTMIQATLLGLIAPAVSLAIKQGADASRATVQRGQAMMLKALIPAAILLAFGGERVLVLFGKQYSVGYEALVLLVVGNLAWAIAALPMLWLQYQGRAQWVLSLSIATLIVDAALNLYLIPNHGMTGAAAGTALTLTAAALAAGWFYRRTLASGLPSGG